MPRLRAGLLLAFLLVLRLRCRGRGAVFVVLQSHDAAGALEGKHAEFVGLALSPRQSAAERGGAGEHLDHVLARTNIPPSQVAVERLGTFEDSAHALDFPDLPARDVSLKCFGVVEHASHVLQVRHIPAAKTDAFERNGFVEHEAGVLHFRHVPARQVAVEGDGSTEHGIGILHVRHIPPADVTVEVLFPREQRAHRRDLRSSPLIERAVRLQRGSLVLTVQVHAHFEVVPVCKLVRL
mmetsp:Transcript_51338/g.143670  ORF Transcript_51338/g.143670 Transcript_51338/m.143670 type:complete len:238 (+) Transcript_51338:165-878(+)